MFFNNRVDMLNSGGKIPARRSRMACTVCRSRKVRCDLVGRGGKQCTNCVLDQKQCVLPPTSRPGKHQPEKSGHLKNIGLKIPSPLTESQIGWLGDVEAMTVPPEALLNVLLAYFIDFVHPELPILDIQQLQGNVLQMVQAGTFSLFVLQALLATTFPHVDLKTLRLLKFETARDASNCYQAKALRLLNIEPKREKEDFVKGLLLLSICSCDAVSGGDESVTYIAHAISLARKEGYHRLELAGKESDWIAKRSTRRLWWSCYTQDRLSNLLTGRKPCISDDEITIPPLSLEDFDFYNIKNSKALISSALAQDTLCQIFLAYLFKWKLELCQHLMTSGHDNSSRFCQNIGAQMNAWYKQHLGSSSSFAVDSRSLKCLQAHWDSLLVLYKTFMFLIARKTWVLEYQHTLQYLQSPGDFETTLVQSCPPLSLKHALETLADILSQLSRRHQVQRIINGGLWALLPAMVTVVQLVTSQPMSHQVATTYREIYLRFLLILESQADCFESVYSSLPFVRRLLTKLSAGASSPCVPFSASGSEPSEVGFDTFEPSSSAEFSENLEIGEDTCTLSQLSLYFDVDKTASLSPDHTESDSCGYISEPRSLFDEYSFINLGTGHIID